MRTLCILACCSLLSHPVRSAEPSAPSPDALVALLPGEDLASTATHRAISRTPASSAAASLVAMKDQAVPALTKALSADDLTLRLNALYVLRLIGTPATLAPRIQAASDSHPQVRATALASLPAYDDDLSRRALIQALKDPSPIVRNASIRAFRPRDRATLPGNSIRFATANLLIRHLDDPDTRFAAADTLGHLAMNVAARPLLKLLKADDQPVRCAAVQALGRLKDRQIALDLTAALRDDDPHVRLYTAQALGQLADLRTTPALVECLAHKDPFLRRDAATALGEIADLRAAGPLLSLLDDPDEQIRSAAAFALGRIADPRAVEPLCALLARGGRQCAAAATALGHLRDPRAIPFLTRHLLTDTAGAREAADALGQIRHPDSVAALVNVILETESTSNAGNAARRALNDLTGASFYHESRQAVSTWWATHREAYLRPIPNKN